VTKLARCCLFALVGFFSNTAAQADFVIKPNPAEGKTPAPVQSVVDPRVIADDPHVDRADEMSSVVPKKVSSRPKLVAGFGDQVPLSFACRQIVPKVYKVNYGPGVDSTALVDWKGGQTWPMVLGRAIRPLGLHIVWSGMNFEIRR
jgi:hypothetical protein